MSSLLGTMGAGKAPGVYWVGLMLVLLVAAMSIPTLHRSRIAPDRARTIAKEHSLSTESAEQWNYLALKAKPAAELQASDTATQPADKPYSTPDATAGRKIVRTSSLELVIEHPAEAADLIAHVAERLGGYVVTADSGGQNAASATLTIRVPTSRFEEARAEIRKLGLRVENEKIEAQDVTRQYVDQDANLRNLRAEESQYLAILKQATTVKDMLAVSAKLSEVRGQIEQQQAEFNALSQQIETVSIAIALRTEAESQAFGLNWRPAYQLKVALRDGLDSLATYASAMTTILFYLPAAVLWLGTIFLAGLGGWRFVCWAGRRWSD